MKLVKLLNGWSSDHIGDEVAKGNLVLCDNDFRRSGLPTVTGQNWLRGSEEHIQAIRQVSGWQRNHKNHYPILVAKMGSDLMISVIRRIFPDIEVEEVDMATRPGWSGNVDGLTGEEFAELDRDMEPFFENPGEGDVPEVGD